VATALNFEATGDGQVAITGDFAMIFEGTSNVVDQYVAYLRRKLGSEVIETVRGAGYRLRAPAPP